jgi:hypothetical protein
LAWGRSPERSSLLLAEVQIELTFTDCGSQGVHVLSDDYIVCHMPQSISDCVPCHNREGDIISSFCPPKLRVLGCTSQISLLTSR